MVGLKKLIGFILSWFLYYIGHLTSQIMFKTKWMILWNIYHYSMMWSMNIQDWAKNKTPWKKVE